MKVYWRIEQRVMGMSMHVTKELMCNLGIAGGKDYFATKQEASKCMDKYARKVASMGMHTEVMCISGTFE